MVVYLFLFFFFENNFKTFLRDFPGGPAVKTLRFHCRERGFDPRLEN